jgi:hypothetical protein
MTETKASLPGPNPFADSIDDLESVVNGGYYATLPPPRVFGKGPNPSNGFGGNNMANNEIGTGWGNYTDGQLQVSEDKGNLEVNQVYNFEISHHKRNSELIDKLRKRIRKILIKRKRWRIFSKDPEGIG